MRLVDLGMAVALATGTVGVAYATPVTIQNGDFSQVTFGSKTPAGTQASVINRTVGQYNPVWITLDGWQVSNSRTAQAVWYGSASDALHGPGGPLLHAVVAPPGGPGAFVGLNGDQGSPGGRPNPDVHAGLQQQLTGLTVGGHYIVSFEWAAAQQAGVSGATSSYLQVSLGNQNHTTDALSIASRGFSDWQSVSFGFTAHSESEWLKFVAWGTGAGKAPMALLTNVSIAVPEPPELATFGLGLLGVGVLTLFARRREKRRL